MHLGKIFNSIILKKVIVYQKRKKGSNRKTGRDSLSQQMWKAIVPINHFDMIHFFIVIGHALMLYKSVIL